MVWRGRARSAFVLGFPFTSFLCLIPFVSDIVAVTVDFLISLLFPVNYSYLNP